MKNTWLGRSLSLMPIAALLILSSCQSQQPNAATTPASGGATATATAADTAQKRTIKVNPSWLLQGDNAPLTMAIDKGYFPAEGLDVKIERGYGSSDTITKVAAGQFEIGFGDIYSMMEFNAKNPNDPVVAVAVPYNRSAFSIVTLKSSNIADPKGLAGKKLGAPAGDAPRKLWPVFAQKTGVQADSVEWITMEPKLRETLLIKGDVDAVSGFATTIIPALEKAGKKPEDMNVFYYTENGLDLYGNAIVVKKAFLDQNPEVVKGFLRAYFKGLQDTLKDPTAGLESVVKAGDSLMDKNAEKRRLQIALERLYITPEVEKVGLGGVDPARLEATAKQVAEVLQIEAPPVNKIVDESFLPPKEERALPPAADRKPLT
ncbi:ABC transporter substrate-binding protein [Microcoleus sp. D3_18a_C4]|uniref:ABC transporter substrate-binding protein n=1 Tax=unclassified Microcoleus TaxID=2642155 RepID=UPI002FD42B54